jgi:hypothetical protein
MDTLRNTIMLIVNGLIVMFYGLVHEKLMHFFGVESTTAQIIVIVGLVVAFLPLLVKPEVYTFNGHEQKSHFVFWKKDEYTTVTYKRMRLLGLIPLGTGDVINADTRLEQPGIKEVTGEIAETVAAFIPVLGPLISQGFTAARQRRLEES